VVNQSTVWLATKASTGAVRDISRDNCHRA